VVRLALPALLWAALPALAQPTEVPPDLARYVRADDGAFKWSVADTAKSAGGTVYTLDLISQKWQGIDWDHKLQVIVPAGVTPKPTMLLYNTGGGPNPRDAAAGLLIAQKVGAPIAYLFGVPKQPLYGNKREDALIAETFVRFLDTKDGTWPLLFPMAKSVVRAMDALQAFAKQELKADVTGFVVTGASKRGWTSWLTAASGDPRVKAIAPMVIDTLNFARQMPHQFASFGGKYSEQIRDYEARKLLPLPETDDARRLWKMVDPWTYRQALTLPKLLIHGTNDPYWAQDATNQYWDDLVGPKYLCYVPNAGHGLRVEDTPNVRGGKVEPIPTQALNTLSAFARSQIDGTPLPVLGWKHTERGPGKVALAVESDTPPTAVRFWTAASDTKDFRKSKWQPVGVPGKNQIQVVSRPEKGFLAFLGEIEFDRGGVPLVLSTQLRIVEPAK
jgi:PhoPQ-activated pathogenicity-related protein